MYHHIRTIFINLQMYIKQMTAVSVNSNKRTEHS